MPLTDVTIRNAKPRAVRYEISDGGSGLGVAVQPSGHKSFVVRLRVHGKQQKLTYPLGVGLKAARALAAGALLRAEQGIDPAAEKRTAKAKAAAARADTVEAVCREYIAREGDGLRTIKTRICTFEQLIYPRIGALPITSVTRNQITRLIDAIEDKHGSRRADLALAYVRRVFRWHEVRDDNFRSPIIAGMGRYPIKEHTRSRVLTDDELRRIWHATETETPFHQLVRFLLLTGARLSEAAELPWGELEGDRWRLPSVRSKTKTELVRPLSALAIGIIAARPRIDDGVFVFSHSGHHRVATAKPKRSLGKASGTSGWRLHDLRRTARTLLSRAGVSVDTAERCLGHSLGGIRGVYDKHDYQTEMARAYAALAKQIDLIVNPPADNVLQMRG